MESMYWVLLFVFRHDFNSFSFYLFKPVFNGNRIISCLSYLCCNSLQTAIFDVTTLKYFSSKFHVEMPEMFLRVYMHSISVLYSHFTQRVPRQLYLRYIIPPHSSIVYHSWGFSTILWCGISVHYFYWQNISIGCSFHELWLESRAISNFCGHLNRFSYVI